MGKFAPDVVIDAMLSVIDNYVDSEAVLSAEPSTYYEACDGTEWTSTTSYSLDDIMVPTTRNGYVYVCTTAGTSAGSEPTWGTTPEATTSDGSVVWTCKTNYQLANNAVTPSDTSISDDSVSGRKLVIGQLGPCTCHTSGTVTHTALLDTASEDLLYVTTTTTTKVGDNDVSAGNSLLLNEVTIILRDPV